MNQWQKNLYILWFTQFLSLTGFGFMMPFIPLYLQELGISSSTELRIWVGLITAIPSLFMGVMAPLWGILSDRIGRKIMILRSMAAGAIVVGLMGLVGNVETVFILRLCQGLFTGTITASATLVAAGTPGRKLSYALGFLSSSTYIGFSFGPLLGGLAAELLGYRRSFFIGSIVIFTGFILVLLFIREIKTEVEAPVPEVRSFSLKALVMPPFVILFLLILLVRFCRTLPNPFIPLYVQEMRAAIQGTAAITGIIIASTGLATAVSGLTIARLGDRYNRVSLIGLFLGIASLSALPIFFTRSLLWFVLFFPLAFYFIGAVEPLLQSHLSANVPPRNRGILMGLQTTAGSIGWFLSPLTASAISIYLSIKHIFIFFSLSLFLTFLVIVVYRLRSVKTFRNV
ncbi:Multidrug resistance protein MdtG [subsurface metagenome]